MGVFTIEFLAGIALWTLASMAGPTGIALVQRRRVKRAAAEIDRLRRRTDDATTRTQDLEAAARDRDRAEAAAAAKSRTLATVSHELRTPLGGILGLADLLAGTPLTPEQRSYVAAVKTSGDALLTLIDDVLDLSRIEAGRLDLTPEPFDPVALVESVVELLAPRAQDKGLEIASFVAPDVPARLIGDPHRLRQVLLNLAGNAVKFTDRGGLGVALQRCPDGRMIFSVADTGPGISADRQTAIFDAFEQAGRDPAGPGQGAGLGLAIVERIVSDMGGELGVGPRAGGGALFAVRMWLDAGADLEAGAGEAGPSPASRSLIVSPGQFQPAYLAAALRGFGGEVVHTASSLDAVTLLQQSDRPFDIVFVDCAGGDAEARTVAAVARLRGAGKVVLLFSPAERRLLQQPVTTCFDEWLVKPIRRGSLAGRLNAQLARAPQPAPQAARPRVLLAEDNPVNALIARTALEKLGSEVVHVTDGESAVRTATAALAPGGRPFDLALMDVSMPLLDGVEATRRIRAAERAGARRPMRIVAATAYAFLDTRLACASAGVDQVLTKPIDPAQLKRLLGAAVQASRPAPYARPDLALPWAGSAG